MGSAVYPTFEVGDHVAFMEFALIHAKKSRPAANKFCVGAVLVDATKGRVISTGYSLEYPQDYKGDPGTTHAEQCCFIKIADEHNLPEERIHEVLPTDTSLYTTMEPCNERLSGNMTCVTRILRLKSAIKTVYVGIREPGAFTLLQTTTDSKDSKQMVSRSCTPLNTGVTGSLRSQWLGTDWFKSVQLRKDSPRNVP